MKSLEKWRVSALDKAMLCASSQKGINHLAKRDHFEIQFARKTSQPDLPLCPA